MDIRGKEFLQRHKLSVPALALSILVALSLACDLSTPPSKSPSTLTSVTPPVTETALQPAATVPAVTTEKEKEDQANLNFAIELERVVGTPHEIPITRPEIYDRLGNLSNYDEWNKDRPKIAQFGNDKGEKVWFGVQADGEIKLTAPHDYGQPFKYPEYDGTKPLVITFDSSFNDLLAKNYLIVYGNQAEITAFNNDEFKNIAKNFLEQYFANTSVPNRALHLVMVKPNNGFPFVNAGSLGNRTPRPDTAQMGQNHYESGTQSGQLVVGRADVMISCQPTQNSANRFGISMDKALKQVLANEIIDLGVKAASGNYDAIVAKKVPETPGTVLSFAVPYDPEMAKIILGEDAYQNFVDYLVNQMATFGQK